MTLNRFCVFGFNDYDAHGGFSDFMASFDTRDKAELFVQSHRHTQSGWPAPWRYDNYQIVDLENVDLDRIHRPTDEIDGVEEPYYA